MARNIQIREPGNNYADVLHPETNSGMVLMANGKTLQNDFDAHKTDNAAHNGFVGKAKVLSVSDFNLLIVPGIYHGILNTTIQNEPYTGTGASARRVTVVVRQAPTGSNIMQEIFYENGTWEGRIYRRNYDVSKWSPWLEIKTSADIPRGVLTATLNTPWSGTSAPYTKTVTVNGIQSSDTPIIDVVMSGTYSTDAARAEAWGYIYRAVTGANSITFYATDKPTVNLPIQIRVVR